MFGWMRRTSLTLCIHFKSNGLYGFCRAWHLMEYCRCIRCFPDDKVMIMASCGLRRREPTDSILLGHYHFVTRYKISDQSIYYETKKSIRTVAHKYCLCHPCDGRSKSKISSSNASIYQWKWPMELQPICLAVSLLLHY